MIDVVQLRKHLFAILNFTFCNSMCQKKVGSSVMRLTEVQKYLINSYDDEEKKNFPEHNFGLQHVNH